MTIAIGNDHAGYALKVQLMEMLKDKYEFTDYGCYSPERYDYPDAAEAVANAIIEGKHERGILICGSGIGISIAANKVPGIRAAACQTHFAAKYCRMHNDAQILCLGERITGPGEAAEMVEAFLEAETEQGRHAMRREKIHAIEAKHFKE
ncbi:MAG: ribose 5-phosphate isomerase B [Clostridiales bacterium]|nr:ribose 5-phosphate isomerase B [Butyricicoccus pullicaecorum]MCI6720016.1 ribose 5-phosphate isomerase B [Clostridiales bacterium]